MSAQKTNIRPLTLTQDFQFNISLARDNQFNSNTLSVAQNGKTRLTIRGECAEFLHLYFDILAQNPDTTIGSFRAIQAASSSQDWLKAFQPDVFKKAQSLNKKAEALNKNKEVPSSIIFALPQQNVA